MSKATLHVKLTSKAYVFHSQSHSLISSSGAKHSSYSGSLNASIACSPICSTEERAKAHSTADGGGSADRGRPPRGLEREDIDGLLLAGGRGSWRAAMVDGSVNLIN